MTPQIAQALVLAAVLLLVIASINAYKRNPNEYD